MRRALLSLALVAGCGAPAAAPPALTADVTQYRRDQVLDRFQVLVTADRDVAVESVQLVADGYADGPLTMTGARLQAGARTALPAPYGPPDCAATPGAATAVLALTDGRQVRLALPAAPVLAQVHERECRARRLADTVELSFGPFVESPGPVLDTALRLRRLRTGEPVVVQDVGGHVLFTLRARPERPLPLLVLAPDQAAAELPLRLVTSRCDGHALAESKRTGLLLLYVGVGTDVPRRVEVPVAPGQLAQLTEFATRSCGLA